LPGIRVKEGESFESALRRFKKKCEKAGIMADPSQASALREAK